MDADEAITNDSPGFQFHGSPLGLILEPGHAPATHFAFEWTEYWLSCPGAASVRSSGHDLERLPGGTFRLHLKNQLGLARLRAFDIDDRPLEHTLDLLVLSRKFPTFAEHTEFFGALLDDLFVRLSHLPFTVDEPTEQQVEEALNPPTAIFALHFLTHEADRIERALRHIRRVPHRKLATIDELVPIHAITNVEADSLLEFVQSPNRWKSASNSRVPLARLLNGRLPESIWQSTPLDSLDTPENRFVLEAARRFAASLADVRAQTWWENIGRPQKRRLLQLGKQLEEFVQNPDWRDLGKSTRPPGSSRVMQRKDGYRDLFALWELFQRARRPLFAALDAAMNVKNVADLYEYWVFLKLIEKLRDLFGIEPVLELRSDVQFGLAWSGAARFAARGTLWYNKPMSGYSNVGLRPDVLWEPGSGRPVAFDAKFRLRETRSGVDKWNDEDLVKMHAYLDALDVRAAIAIYPGDLSRFWHRSRETLVPSLRYLVETEIEGIGALSRTPGNGD